MTFKIFKQSAVESLILQEMPFRSELNMEAFIIENPHLLATDSPDSTVNIVINQLNLKNGRKSKNTNGRIDLIANIDSKYIGIIELKNSKISTNHLDQLRDYLVEFSNRKQELIGEIKQISDVQGDTLLGVIVGTEFDKNIREILISSKVENDIKIIGISLVRYNTGDKGDVYIISETIAPQKSDFVKIRFNSWDEFNQYQTKENSISNGIMAIAKQIHDFSIEMFDMSANQIVYAKNAFTLNVSTTKRKSVFAYCHLQKNKVRVFMEYEGMIPRSGIQNPDKRAPNSYYMDISSSADSFEYLKKNMNVAYNKRKEAT